MKKKLLALSILPFLLTGCSLFDGIFDGGESYTYTSKNSGEPSTNTSIGSSSSNIDTNTSAHTRPYIIFDSEGFEYEEKTENYLITMKQGSSITINATIGNGDTSKYSLIYSWLRGGENGTINGNTITINEDALIGAAPYVKIELMEHNSPLVIDIILIRINIVEKYEVSVISKRDDVIVSKSSQALVDFNITVPLANTFYELPVVKLEGYEGSYTVEFINDDSDYYKDKIEFKYDSNATYFQIVDKYNMLSNYRFNALIKDNDNNLLRYLVFAATETLESDDVLSIFYGQYSEKLVKDSTLTIEKEELTPIQLTSFFNGNQLATYSSQYVVSSSDESVVKIVKKYISNTSYYFVSPQGKLGTSNITISYTFKDKEYAKSFNVSVVDTKTLEAIYVPAGEKAFEIEGNNVYLSGKIYAIYSVGDPESINGHPNLQITVSDSYIAGAKNVTVEFTYRGVTKSQTYVVGQSIDTHTKADLYRNYQSVWSQAGFPTMPSKGDAAVLVIPIWFTDSGNFINPNKSDDNGSNQSQQVLEDLETAIFGENDEVPWRSLKTYYREESYGALNIVGKVSNWYDVDYASTTYSHHDTNISNLAASAVKWYFDNNPSESRSDYDKNGDGKIDSLLLYYGTNYHCFRDNGQPQAANWVRRTNSTGDSYISNYAWMSFGSIYDIDGLKTSMTGQLDAQDLSLLHGLATNTLIHEVGHCLGLNDYYDKTMTSEPVGVLNMQSSDAGGHDAYSVMALGWAKPYVFSRNHSSSSNEISITINDLQSSGDMILLTPSWSDVNETFDEYMLLELYTPTGLNRKDALRTDVNNAKVPGIRLWHVNAKLGSNNRHLYDNTSTGGTNYDLLHLIRNDVNKDYRSLSRLSDVDLFKEGESFDMSTFKSQFYNHDGKLDNGLNLGWKFEVTKINQDSYGNASATIKLIKE